MPAIFRLRANCACLSGAIITPSARDLAKELGVKIIEMAKGESAAPASADRTIAIGCDHGGFEMKQKLLPVFEDYNLAVRGYRRRLSEAGGLPGYRETGGRIGGGRRGGARCDYRRRGDRIGDGREQISGRSGGPMLR